MNASNPKHVVLMHVMEERILRGDYDIRELPTEQGLASEAAVSRRTARRALLQLMEKGLLIRKPYGRVEVNRAAVRLSGAVRLAFLSPSFSSADFDLWRFAVTRAALAREAQVRMVEFIHWNDPVIPQTLASFDGVFLVPSSETIPEAILNRFSLAKNLIVLDGDLTAYGVPSIELMRPAFLDLLADHLYSLGHRRIACLNTQPHDDVIKRRIEQWIFWQKVHGIEGQFIDEPVEPYGDTISKAYEAIGHGLDSGQFNATGVVCLTGAAAVGAARSLHDHGKRVCRDVSVCALTGDATARYMMPSHTAVRLPDPTRYITICIEWLARLGEPWVGPLLIQPSNISLFKGESTGPAPE